MLDTQHVRMMPCSYGRRRVVGRFGMLVCLLLEPVFLCLSFTRAYAKEPRGRDELSGWAQRISQGMVVCRSGRTGGEEKGERGYMARVETHTESRLSTLSRSAS